MIRDPLQSAIRAGIPFVINMAYGKSSEVRESWKIAVGRARVVVLEARSARVPPMLTMTGISYLPKKTAKSKAPRMTRITRIFRETLWSAAPLRRFWLHRRKNASTLQRFDGFTLLELLIVIGIIGLLLVLIAPAFTTIKGGGDVTSAAYTIKGVLDTARTYAKANNTYTWVGFKEVDVSRDPSISPQVAGTGRLAVAIVASKDGTRGYDVTNANLPNPAWTNYSNGTNLVAVAKLQYLDNIHLAGALTMAGNMARPNISSNNYLIGNSPASVTPFDWPLGSVLNGGQYSFQKVINFDPQGVARIQYSTNAGTISAYTEVGLQQTHGVTVDVNSPNVVAIQLSGVGSSVTIYRP